MTAGPHDLSPGRDHVGVGVGALVFGGEGRYETYAGKYGLGKFW